MKYRLLVFVFLTFCGIKSSSSQPEEALNFEKAIEPQEIFKQAELTCNHQEDEDKQTFKNGEDQVQNNEENKHKGKPGNKIEQLSLPLKSNGRPESVEIEPGNSNKNPNNQGQNIEPQRPNTSVKGQRNDDIDSDHIQEGRQQPPHTVGQTVDGAIATGSGVLHDVGQGAQHVVEEVRPPGTVGENVDGAINTGGNVLLGLGQGVQHGIEGIQQGFQHAIGRKRRQIKDAEHAEIHDGIDPRQNPFPGTVGQAIDGTIGGIQNVGHGIGQGVGGGIQTVGQRFQGVQHGFQQAVGGVIHPGQQQHRPANQGQRQKRQNPFPGPVGQAIDGTIGGIQNVGHGIGQGVGGGIQTVGQGFQGVQHGFQQAVGGVIHPGQQPHRPANQGQRQKRQAPFPGTVGQAIDGTIGGIQNVGHGIGQGVGQGVQTVGQGFQGVQHGFQQAVGGVIHPGQQPHKPGNHGQRQKRQVPFPGTVGQAIDGTIGGIQNVGHGIGQDVGGGIQTVGQGFQGVQHGFQQAVGGVIHPGQQPHRPGNHGQRQKRQAPFPGTVGQAVDGTIGGIQNIGQGIGQGIGGGIQNVGQGFQHATEGVQHGFQQAVGGVIHPGQQQHRPANQGQRQKRQAPFPGTVGQAIDGTIGGIQNVGHGIGQGVEGGIQTVGQGFQGVQHGFQQAVGGVIHPGQQPHRPANNQGQRRFDADILEDDFEVKSRQKRQNPVQPPSTIGQNIDGAIGAVGSGFQGIGQGFQHAVESVQEGAQHAVSGIIHPSTQPVQQPPRPPSNGVQGHRQSRQRPFPGIGQAIGGIQGAGQGISQGIGGGAQSIQQGFQNAAQGVQQGFQQALGGGVRRPQRLNIKVHQGQRRFDDDIQEDDFEVKTREKRQSPVQPPHTVGQNVDGAIGAVSGGISGLGQGFQHAVEGVQEGVQHAVGGIIHPGQQQPPRPANTAPQGRNVEEVDDVNNRQKSPVTVGQILDSSIGTVAGGLQTLGQNIHHTLNSAQQNIQKAANDAVQQQTHSSSPSSEAPKVSDKVDIAETESSSNQPDSPIKDKDKVENPPVKKPGLIQPPGTVGQVVDGAIGTVIGGLKDFGENLQAGFQGARQPAVNKPQDTEEPSQLVSKNQLEQTNANKPIATKQPIPLPGTIGQAVDGAILNLGNVLQTVGQNIQQTYQGVGEPVNTLSRSSNQDTFEERKGDKGNKKPASKDPNCRPKVKGKDQAHNQAQVNEDREGNNGQSQVNCKEEEEEEVEEEIEEEPPKRNPGQILYPGTVGYVLGEIAWGLYGTAQRVQQAIQGPDPGPGNPKPYFPHVPGYRKNANYGHRGGQIDRSDDDSSIFQLVGSHAESDKHDKVGHESQPVPEIASSIRREKRGGLVSTTTSYVSKVLITHTSILTTWKSCFATAASMPVCSSRVVHPQQEVPVAPPSYEPPRGARSLELIEEKPFLEVDGMAVPFSEMIRVTKASDLHRERRDLDTNLQASPLNHHPSSLLPQPRNLFTLVKSHTVPLTTSRILTATAYATETLRFTSDSYHPGCLPLAFLQSNSVGPCEVPTPPPPPPAYGPPPPPVYGS